MKHVELFESFMDLAKETDESPITVSLDWSPSTDTAEFLDNLDGYCKSYNLKIIGLVPVGEAGGNPNITFMGKKTDLIDMALSAGFEEEDIAYISQQVAVDQQK